MSVVVGIAGGSGSGKTTLAEGVVRAFAPGTAVRLPHDAYYRDLAHLPAAARATRNFDHPEALDTALFIRHIHDLLRGETIAVPRYDFEFHTRLASARNVEPAPVVLVDGMMVLALPEIRRMLDLGVFVHAEPEERLARRIARDSRERGRSRESVLAQWKSSVVPMHRRFVEPSRTHAQLVVERGGLDPRSVELVVSRIAALPGAGDVDRGTPS